MDCAASTKSSSAGGLTRQIPDRGKAGRICVAKLVSYQTTFGLNYQEKNMNAFIQVPPAPAKASGYPASLDLPSTLPVWVLVAIVLVREIGVGGFLKSVQEGRQKSSDSHSSLTEKVVTQVLDQYGKLTSAVERLTSQVEELTEETKALKSVVEQAVTKKLDLAE